MHVSLDATAILDKILGIISKVIKWTHFETMSPTVLLSLFNADYNQGNDQKNLWLVSKLFKEGAEGLERSEYTDNFYRS